MRAQWTARAADVRSMFRQLDRDHDGNASLDDLQALVGRFNLYVSKKELAGVIKTVGRDTYITQDDIQSVVLAKSRPAYQSESSALLEKLVRLCHTRGRMLTGTAKASGTAPENKVAKPKQKTGKPVVVSVPAEAHLLRRIKRMERDNRRNVPLDSGGGGEFDATNCEALINCTIRHTGKGNESLPPLFGWQAHAQFRGALVAEEARSREAAKEPKVRKHAPIPHGGT